jgi:aryl-alcohol dehydrogenase-like predicted oxidoreductase
MNFFDTANAYSLGRSDEITGKALGEMAKRDEVIIATKVWYPMGDAPNSRGISRKHIMDSIDASFLLPCLGVDGVPVKQNKGL